MLDLGYLVYFIGLPLLGTLIALYFAFSAHKKVANAIMHEKDSELRIRGGRMKLMVMMMLPFTAVIFGFAGFILLSKPSRILEESIITAIGINIGLAGLFCALGEGAIMHGAAKDMIKKPENFGKHLVPMTNCEISLIFAFVVLFLSLDSTASIGQITTANYIMAIASVGGLVSGVLVAMVEPTRFTRRLYLSLISAIAGVIGFVIAYGTLANLF
jgi:F0F1-type ATP synthase membrane subunit c/vacuolar-type H+-ATPase subunit K